MKLVVQIPALNEAITIQEVIEKIPREIEGVDIVEVSAWQTCSTACTWCIAFDANCFPSPTLQQEKTKPPNGLRMHSCNKRRPSCQAEYRT